MKFEDITFVVQGAINSEKTHLCLKSIRNFMPGSKIILSTWEGSNLESCKELYDDVVLSKDPGKSLYNKNNNSKLNNINRQIVSTYEGLKAVNTPYVFKFRTDFYLTGNGFLKYFGKYNKFHNKFKIVSERILSCSVYARNPNITPFPMHPSDFIFFGLKDDVIKLFDIPLMTEDQANHFKEKPSPIICNKDSGFLHQFHPEQYLWINFLKYDKCKHLSHTNKEIISDTILSFVNNLVLLSPKQLSISSFNKYLFISYSPESCFSYYDWIYFYRTHCDKSIKINIKLIYSIIKRKIYSTPILLKIIRLLFQLKRTDKITILKIFKIPIYVNKRYKK